MEKENRIFINRKKRPDGIIGGSIRHQKIVWVIVAVIVAFGVYALFDM